MSEKGGRDRDVGGGTGRVVGLQGLQGITTRAVSRTHGSGMGGRERERERESFIRKQWMACMLHTRTDTCAHAHT